MAELLLLLYYAYYCLCLLCACDEWSTLPSMDLFSLFLLPRAHFFNCAQIPNLVRLLPLLWRIFTSPEPGNQ